MGSSNNNNNCFGEMYLSTDTVQGHTILAGGEAEIIVLGSVPTHYRIDKSGQRSVSITFWPKPQLWSFPAKGRKGQSSQRSVRGARRGAVGAGTRGGETEGGQEKESLWRPLSGRFLSAVAKAMPLVLPLPCSERSTWPSSSSAGLGR